MKGPYGFKVLGTIAALLFLGLSSVQAADGSGSMVVNPGSVKANTSGNNFDFTYTASEHMGDGAVTLTVPDPWPDPDANNTTVTVTNGLTGMLIDGLDTPDLGWHTDISGLCVLCTISHQTDTDPGDVHAGTGSLEILGGLGVGVGSSARIFFNYGAPQDWSGFTHLSFWIRNDAVLDVSLLTGAFLEISESTNLGSSTVTYPLSGAILDVTLLSQGKYTQVIVNLTSKATSTRDAVRSYGLVIPSLASVSLNGDIHLDHIMAGPADPIFSGNTAEQDLIYLNKNGTVKFTYHGITAPDAEGVYSFPSQQAVDSSGDLTDLASFPEITVTPDTEISCTDGVDNDGDGLLDCADPECSGDPHCHPEVNCTDHIDNDLDGKFDCADSDCVGNDACIPETNCTDGIDNDHDGDVDCADFDCSDTPACPKSETSCNNGVDDDHDGAVDCADSDCAGNPACTNPGGDDDHDGVPNNDDNCVTTANPDQADRDGDGIGDACDDTINQDIDNDGQKEQATDTNGDGCFGDRFFDPDGSSVACLSSDGDNDHCSDFFIDTNGDGCDGICPDVFWDPTNNVLSSISQSQLDTNGDGIMETVCAFDSNGDGKPDSFITPPSSTGGGNVGGEGAGQPNPFEVTGGGCSLENNSAPSNTGALIIFLIVVASLTCARLAREPF